jgi:hypothetical protein
MTAARGGRTYIVTGQNDYYRNRQKIEFIVNAIVLVYRNTLSYRKIK